MVSILQCTAHHTNTKMSKGILILVVQIWLCLAIKFKHTWMVISSIDREQKWPPHPQGTKLSLTKWPTHIRRESNHYCCLSQQVALRVYREPYHYQCQIKWPTSTYTQGGLNHHHCQIKWPTSTHPWGTKPPPPSNQMAYLFTLGSHLHTVCLNTSSASRN